jgi:ribosomal protein L11
MLRGTSLGMLKHRPASVPTAVSSNRFADPKYLKAAKEVFATPPFPRKHVMHNFRYFLRPGKATSGSPVGQDFTKLGLKAMDFCKLFNDKTKPLFKDDAELVLRVQMYHDKTYTWRLEPPPTAWFLMRAIRKKRRETGHVEQRGAYTAYVTLEMLFEIAKLRYATFGNESEPDRFEATPLEDRVDALARQARKMGIAIIGVDCPSSPVSGVSAAAYAKQSEEYRAQQYKLWMEYQQQRLEKAPLIERIHRPNVARLSMEQLKAGLNDPKLAEALWRVTAPSSKFARDLRDRHAAVRMLQHAGWIDKAMTLEEARAYFVNWRLPSVERMRQLHGAGDSGGEMQQAASPGRDDVPS